MLDVDHPVRAALLKTDRTAAPAKAGACPIGEPGGSRAGRLHPGADGLERVLDDALLPSQLLGRRNLLPGTAAAAIGERARGRDPRRPGLDDALEIGAQVAAALLAHLDLDLIARG